MSRRYDDDFEGNSFEKFTKRHSKKHKKGHQSRSSGSERYGWAQLMEQDEYIEDYPMADLDFKPQQPKTVITYPKKAEHQFSDNTHEIKGVKIDFNGVADIQKIENLKDGATTYGIKFIFTGVKGLYRTIWFNTNFRARDSVFNAEYAYWLSLKTK